MKIANKTRVNLLKIFILVFCIALFLTGCATVSDVKDKNGKNVIIRTLDIGGDNAVHAFREKSIGDGAPINAGFMVLEPEIFDYIEGDNTVFERGPLERLAAKGELMSYMHRGYWQCMDTKREMDMLENLWQSGHAPWKVWVD